MGFLCGQGKQSDGFIMHLSDIQKIKVDEDRICEENIQKASIGAKRVRLVKEYKFGRCDWSV